MPLFYRRSVFQSMRMDRSTLLERIAVGVLLALFMSLSLASARHKSITVDEPKHYEYGLQILNLDSTRLNSGGTVVDDSKMPFTALNALPAKLAPWLPDGWLKRFSGTIQAGRPVTIAFSVLTAFVMFLWAKRLYGTLAALFSLFLYVFEPSIIAHSHLVTTDIYAMGMMLFTVFSLWHYNQRPSPLRLLLLSGLLGLSQLAKFSMVFLVPLLVVIQAAHDLPSLVAWERAKDRSKILNLFSKRAGAGAVMGIVSLMVVNAGYFFNGSLTRLADYDFTSRIFQGIQAKLGFLGWMPIPLPYPYLQGLDLVSYRDQTGYGVSRIFLLGKLSPHGFPGYYFVDLAIKTPLPLLIAVVIGIVLLFARKPGWRRILSHEAFLLVPVLWALIFMNFVLHAQVGIRLILVIFPFMFILAGNLVRDTTRKSRFARLLALALGAWLVWSVMSFYPNFLPYSSELIQDKRKAYSYLAQGEFDHGQSERYLEDWMAQHPGAILDPPQPVAGTIVATPKYLVGTPKNQDPDKYAWLRDNFKPVDVIAYTYPVFQVTENDLDRLGLGSGHP